MANNKKAPIVENPELLDAVIGEAQNGLVDNIGWLDYAFGRAERVVRIGADSRKKIYTPNVYNGSVDFPNDYVDVSPDSNFGNFCFFWIDDPQAVKWESRITLLLQVNISIIFWFDLRTIFDRTERRDKEILKKELLNVINTRLGLTRGHIEINNVYELAENIYKGFSIDEVDNQFLMHPYAGFRFEGTLTAQESCKP